MLKKYGIILVVFLLIDAVWLGLVAPSLYQKEIGHLMTKNIKFSAAFVFYLIYALAILIFVVNPSLEKNNLFYAFIYGSFLGFAMYATYDLTNLATLKDWPIKITIIDLIWGSFVTGTTAIISSKIIQYFNF